MAMPTNSSVGTAIDAIVVTLLALESDAAASTSGQLGPAHMKAVRRLRVAAQAAKRTVSDADATG